MLNKFYDTHDADATHFTLRMTKERRGEFSSQVRRSDVKKLNTTLGEQDIVRYYFQYWVVPTPHDGSDSGEGLECQTPLHWFATPANATSHATDTRVVDTDSNV
uniref:Alpha-1,4-glucan:maltose-1-phosphate maltosyltransferase n=1 Tax=Lygus hesperus TaxID=30085 RepID=A0A0A9YFM7_LYGHE